jgi:membrane associated rhomboid family serine protease
MLLVITLAIFVLTIILYNPDKASLKDTNKTPVSQRIVKAKGTLLLGAILVVLALLSFDPASLKIKTVYAQLFGLSWSGILAAHLLFQFVTNIFFHFDFLHLLANLSTLLLLSAYERRVGMARFLSVFFISGVAASVLDIFFLSTGAVTLGASGGLCGLVGGYFLDHENVSPRQWGSGLAMVLIVIFITSVLPDQNADPTYSVNWLGHLLGALCAAMYIRLHKLSH